jgi:hypothetical protein
MMDLDMFKCSRLACARFTHDGDAYRVCAGVHGLEALLDAIHGA